MAREPITYMVRSVVDCFTYRPMYYTITLRERLDDAYNVITHWWRND